MSTRGSDAARNGVRAAYDGAYLVRLPSASLRARTVARLRVALWSGPAYTGGHSPSVNAVRIISIHVISSSSSSSSSSNSYIIAIIIIIVINSAGLLRRRRGVDSAASRTEGRALLFLCISITITTINIINIINISIMIVILISNMIRNINNNAGSRGLLRQISPP